VVAACGINVGLDGMGETSLGDLGLRESGDRQVRILVVEDDPALQRMILNYFGENNIHTLERFDVGRAAPARDTEHGRFRFCGWQLDCRTRRFTDPAGTPVALLLAFLNAPQRPLSREYLLQATRMHEGVFDRSIDGAEVGGGGGN
jgi:DNA-binding response OmpR family regulator